MNSILRILQCSYVGGSPQPDVYGDDDSVSSRDQNCAISVGKCSRVNISLHVLQSACRARSGHIIIIEVKDLRHSYI